MAISPDNIITYRNLTDTFLAWLKTSCKNIGSYASDVPAYFKTNYTNQVSTTFQTYNQEGNPVQSTAGTNINIRANTVIPVVSVATIESDFNNFMTARDNIIGGY